MTNVEGVLGRPGVVVDGCRTDDHYLGGHGPRAVLRTDPEHVGKIVEGELELTVDGALDIKNNLLLCSIPRLG